jgi:2-keto-3-deoxy-galactonokinase
LIGADIAFGLQQGAGDVVFVMGSPTLTRLYAAAIDAAGRRATEIDGETAFLAGINAIAGQI